MSETVAAIVDAAEQVELARRRSREALDAATDAAYELILELELCGLSVRVTRLRDEGSRV